MKTICIAGKNDISVNVLEYVYENYGEVCDICVVCNKGESGVNTWQRSLRKYATTIGVKEVTLQEVYEIEELVFLSLESAKILEPRLFKSKQLYNIHFSKLPAYKGCHTSVMPLLNNEKQVGVTLHYIEEGIDTGAIIDTELIELEENTTSLELYFKFMSCGTRLVIKNIGALIEGKINAVDQGYEDSSYFPLNYIDYKSITINLNQTAQQIKNQIRAFNFRPYQLPCLNERAVVWCKITDCKSKYKAGTIIEEGKHSILCATVDYDVRLYFDRLDELLQACRNDDVVLVKEICQIYGMINAFNNKGWTPLIVATYNNSVNCVEALVGMGADIHVTSNNGTNLLMYAKDAYINTGDARLIKLYLKLGLSPFDEDYDNKNLFYYIRQLQMAADEKDKILRLLEER